MTEATPVTLTGEQMFAIRKSALEIAIQARQPDDQTPKLLYDASAYLNFLLNGLPVDSVAGYVTAPKPNTPEVLAAAGGTPVDPPKATRGKAKLTTVPTGIAPVVQATVTPVTEAAAPTAAPTSASPAIVPAPTTLQAAADSLKALVQDEARGGRKAAVDLLQAFGVAQLNQVPASRLAEFKAALDAAGKAAPAPAAAPGSDLL